MENESGDADCLFSYVWWWLGAKCSQLEIEVLALKDRNREMFDSFAKWNRCVLMSTRYRSQIETLIRSKDDEIMRRMDVNNSWVLVNSMIEGEKKDTESLLSTIKDLTDKLVESERLQASQSSAMATMKDELEVWLCNYKTCRWNEQRVLR